MSIVRLENVCVRKGDKHILSDISWELMHGENWAVIGGNGAGKSTFLSLIRGDIWPVQNIGSRLYCDAQGKTSLSPIGFREHTTVVSADVIEHYLTLERELDGKTLLMTGLHNTPLIYTKPTADEWDAVALLAQRMSVSELLDKKIIECSTGQIKRLFLARALASSPTLLFLDEYADGLDRASRAEVLELIDRMAAEGVQIVCATHRATELPACINRILMLEGGRVIHAGGRTSALDKSLGATLCCQSEEQTAQAGQDIFPEAVVQGAPMDFSLLPPPQPVCADVPVIALQNASAGVLQNISLDIQAGERWMITGANGAGKSTLLRMMMGELPAAYGGSVRWFGQERIPSGGEYKDFWAIKRRMGIVTPRLQTLHRMEITILDVVLSGFWQHIGLHSYPTEEMKAAACGTMTALGIADMAERTANTLSYGQLRKAIIARALVNNPSVLLLDEPFSGLDAPSRRDMHIIFDALAELGLTMVLATHHPEESRYWATHCATVADGLVHIDT